ncbi:response regulator [Bradyrhizobium prioriisuperbiae]|uniref:response regulator n=1 Tax=Bradyrhizobium prioriisuperbiae TaxID=2854389 RepID=UPI0028EE6BB2|nr:response regulator [Bradyrhizobium prioritasuperba]
MKTVLVVEDEWAIADWLEVLLSERGYHVLAASNGRQALDILHHETPDLVLTDFMMPFVDGAGLVTAMAENPRTKQIPVVVMTSLLESAVRERLTGHKAVLRKPFREGDLFRILDEIVPISRD